MISSEKLRSLLIPETGPEGWGVLKPHVSRGALIIVSDELDLVQTGAAIARDQADQIGEWIITGKLSKPTPSQVSEWEKGQTDFLCLIVQPYVLVQVKKRLHS